jgi:hypothetical protein
LRSELLLELKEKTIEQHVSPGVISKHDMHANAIMHGRIPGDVAPVVRTVHDHMWYGTVVCALLYYNIVDP